MPAIHLTTFIAAPIERVFDLSRSIDLHKKAMAQNQEHAVSGTTSGLIGLKETVTWTSKHLYKVRVLKTLIIQMERPFLFTSEMVNGDFRSMKHEHHFKRVNNGSVMIDLFSFETPYGNIGKIFNSVFLTGYLKKLLEKRNRLIKEYAESDKWKFVLTI